MGLTNSEAACLRRWIAAEPCVNGICPSVNAGEGATAVAEALHARGLVEYVDCSQDDGYHHARPNATAKVALMADAAARGSLVIA